jgi:DivIVA domain-containing protein
MGKKDKTGTDTGLGGPQSAPGRLTPIDIQQKEFRVSRFGGYKMRDVDEFLDQITDAFTSLTSEIERLRAGGQGPVVGSPDLDDVSRQADEIIARARAEATRITAEARAGATPSVGAGEGGAPDRAGVNEFIARERAFLQSLAGLVQEHAETVKGMAKASRPPKATRSAPTPAEPERIEPAPAAQAEAGRAVAEPQQASPAAPGFDRGERSDDGARDPAPRPDAEPTVRIEEPANAAATRGDAESEGDRSLRDLFWGED